MKTSSAVGVFFLVVVICVGPNEALAQKTRRTVVTREYTVLGARSCKDWVDARKQIVGNDISGSINELAATNWLLGYLSGMNRATSSDADLLKGVDFNVAAEWTDRYCEKNPRKDLTDAAEAMFSKMGLKP